MRRLLCLIIPFALIASARGQTAYSYRYWFDAGDTVVWTGTATSGSDVKLDISTIAKGSLHALHIQALDARNKWGAVHTSYFFYTRGAGKNASARYWFDSEETRRTASTLNGMAKFDVDGLDCGVHVLHFQMSDADGNPSPVQNAYFYKGAKGATARYWFDDTKTMKAAPTIDGVMNLDIEGLACGVHAVHFQSFSAAGNASPVHTAYFYKGAKGATARYWFDNQKTMQTTSTLDGTMELDVDGLDHGVHALHFQTFSAKGDASPVQTAYFYKRDDALSCRLWIDEETNGAQTYSLDEDIVLETATLSIGMHDLHVVLLNAGGHQLSEKTIPFEVLDPDGITFIPASALEDGAMYNVAGQRIQRMQKGIYIKNGKKVLVK